MLECDDSEESEFSAALLGSETGAIAVSEAESLLCTFPVAKFVAVAAGVLLCSCVTEAALSVALPVKAELSGDRDPVVELESKVVSIEATLEDAMGSALLLDVSAELEMSEEETVEMYAELWARVENSDETKLVLCASPEEVVETCGASEVVDTGRIVPEAVVLKYPENEELTEAVLVD